MYIVLKFPSPIVTDRLSLGSDVFVLDLYRYGDFTPELTGGIGI